MAARSLFKTWINSAYSCQWDVYVIKKLIHGYLEIWNFSSLVQFDIYTCSLRSLVRYHVEHSKRNNNSVSPRTHVLFSIYLSCTFQEKYIAVVPSLQMFKWDVTLSPTLASNMTRLATPTWPGTLCSLDPFHCAVWPLIDKDGPKMGWGTTSAMFARGSLRVRGETNVKYTVSRLKFRR